MKLKRSRRPDARELLEASMSRIVDHLESDDVATITSFITQGEHRRPGHKDALSRSENERRNKRLARDLEYLGYSFIRVDGEYTQTGHSAPVSESSFFVLKPESYTLKTFRRDMIGLAIRYEQESVIIWDHAAHRGTLYSTTNFKNYVPTLTFRDFTVDGARECAWTAYRKNWFTFDESVRRSYRFRPTALSEGVGEPVVGTHPYHFGIRRRELFGEWY